MEKTRTLRLLMALVALVALVGCSAGVTPSSTSTASDSAPPAATADEGGGEGLPTDPNEEPGSEPDSEPSTSNYVPKKADWKLRIKITDKTCYGSGVGCSLEARVTARSTQPKSAFPDHGTVDITYKITGDENGPQIGTITLYLADQNQEYGSHSLSTPSSATKVTAKITEVEYNALG